MGIVNVVGSMIATMVDCGVYLNCGREVAVAATKSFLS
jgi:glucosamine--fructose-6-phosphate aminotransferase (isomerizing)